MTYPGARAYPRGMTPTVPTENGPSNVRMTPAAIDALHELARPQAEAVARAIASIGQTELKPVAAPQGNGRQYYAVTRYPLSSAWRYMTTGASSSGTIA